MDAVIAWLYLICMAVVFPLLLVWGWVRWLRGRKQFLAVSVFSLLGFALATSSATLAVIFILKAHAIGGFRFYDPQLMRAYSWGAILSAVGLLMALIGTARPSSLRWYAPICSFATLFFWLASAMGE